MQRFHLLDGLILDPYISFLELMVPLVDYNLKLPLILFIKYKEIQAISKSLSDESLLKDKGFIFDENCDVWDVLSRQMPSDITRQFNQAKQMMSMLNSMEQVSNVQSSEQANEHQTYSNNTSNLYESVMDILNNTTE